MLSNDALANCIYRFSRGDKIEDIRNSVLLWIQVKEIQKRVIANILTEFKKACVLYQSIKLDIIYDALTMMAFSVAPS